MCDVSLSPPAPGLRFHVCYKSCRRPLESVAPTLPLYCPGTQAIQLLELVAPGLPLYRPATQSLHLLAPNMLLLNRPAVQSMQLLELVAAAFAIAAAIFRVLYAADAESDGAVESTAAGSAAAESSVSEGSAAEGATAAWGCDERAPYHSPRAAELIGIPGEFVPGTAGVAFGTPPKPSLGLTRQ